MCSLTEDQGWELFHLMQIYRWGEDTFSRPLERSELQSMTWDEFNRMKAQQEAEEDAWRRARGLPPRFSK